MAKKKGQDQARAASPTKPVSEKIHARIAEKFGEAVSLVDAVDPYTVVEAENLLQVMQYLRDDPEMQFDFLRGVSGVDYPDDKKVASVYHLFSYPQRHAHVVKVFADRAAPMVPSVEEIWPTANWFEREAYDLLGIVYAGNTDLRRIMLPDDWVGHPLRKDYVEETEYHGVGTTRPSPLEAFRQMDEARRKAKEERGEELPPPRKSSIEPPADFQPPTKAKPSEEVS